MHPIFFHLDETLKKVFTDAAEVFKDSWMKVRKILKLSQGFFEAFDEFFQDSIMQRAANMSVSFY